MAGVKNLLERSTVDGMSTSWSAGVGRETLICMGRSGRDGGLGVRGKSGQRGHWPSRGWKKERSARPLALPGMGDGELFNHRGRGEHREGGGDVYIFCF